MKLPTQPQILAGLRYAGVTAGTIGTVVTVVGLLPSGEAHSVVEASQKVLTDLQQLVGDAYLLAGLVFPIVVGVLAKLGWNSAGPQHQVATVQASPTEQVLTTDPKVAEATPGVKLVDKLPG